jgi:hypothetical protein
MMDLYVIPMRYIAVILGMDWLPNHGDHIDCEENTVMIREPRGGKAVYQGAKHTRMEVRIEDILVVKEFQDVFPKELPGMPSDREIEFTIDLIPRTAPIAEAPYKMGPKALGGLKAQIDEPEEK